MVAYCVTKIIPTCSPVIGQFFDTIIIAFLHLHLLSTFTFIFIKFCHFTINLHLKSGCDDPSKSKAWKVLETS